jgi:hypothetical protein
MISFFLFCIPIELAWAGGTLDSQRLIYLSLAERKKERQTQENEKHQN